MDVVHTRLESAGGTFEFCHGDWPRPTKVLTNRPDHSLLFYLPPIDFAGAGRFLDFQQSEFRPVGPVFLRPANVTLESLGTGGRTRVVRYTFTPERLADIADGEVVWGRRELESGLDLDRSQVGPLMLRLMQEMKAPGFASRALMDAIGVNAIVELLRRLGSAESSKGERGRLRAGQIALIRERVMLADSPTPSVGELARLCGMSDRTLLRLFKRTTGETVAAFVRQIRIDEARALLKTTDLALKEVAFRLGFSSHSSFAAAFHREVGVTPFDYRRENR